MNIQISRRDTLRHLLAMLIVGIWPLTPRRVWKAFLVILKIVPRVLRLTFAYLFERANFRVEFDEILSRASSAIPAESGPDVIPVSSSTRRIDRIAQWANYVINSVGPQIRNKFIATDYNVVTMIWYQSIAATFETRNTFRVLSRRVNEVISGERPPFLVNLQLNKPTNSDLTNYLRAGDALSAFRHLETSESDLPDDPHTAVVHLVVRGEGTYALISSSGSHPDIILCPTFRRANMVKLLRGWLWLYFWYREDILESTLAALSAQRKIKATETHEFEDFFQYAVHQSVFQDRLSYEEFLPSEIPEDHGKPYLPLPVWILTEVFLRMLGEGYSWSTPGLWSQIHPKLQAAEIKRVIICADPALTVFPHHAAILALDAAGHKVYLQDFYDICYLPWGYLQRSRPRDDQQLTRLAAFGDPAVSMTGSFLNSLQQIAPDRVELASANRESVRRSLSHANGFTYYGHAEYDWGNPDYSNLHLAGRCLNLINLSKMIHNPLGVAILAGCETGMPIYRDMSLAYENVTCRLIERTKCNAIVASSWRANPVSTLILMRRFHTLLFEQIALNIPLGLAASGALSQSQRWLRNLSSADVINQLNELQYGINQPSLQVEAERMARQIVRSPYSHPFFWSPFYFTGRPI
jgi:CHAT domain-containing protein